MATPRSPEEIKVSQDYSNLFCHIFPDVPTPKQSFHPETTNDTIIKGLLIETNQVNLQLDANTIFRAIKGFVEKGNLNTVFAKVKPVYHFEIIKESGTLDIYTIDFKANLVSRGAVGNPDSVYNLTESDFVAIATKQLLATKAIVEKRLKIRGSKHMASKLMPKLFPAVTPELLTEFANAKL